MRNLSFARTADRIAKNLDRLGIMDHKVAYKKLLKRLENNELSTLELREIASYLSSTNPDLASRTKFGRQLAQKLKRTA